VQTGWRGTVRVDTKPRLSHLHFISMTAFCTSVQAPTQMYRG
jgi:hypothetical protein